MRRRLADMRAVEHEDEEDVLNHGEMDSDDDDAREPAAYGATSDRASA